MSLKVVLKGDERLCSRARMREKGLKTGEAKMSVKGAEVDG